MPVHLKVITLEEVTAGREQDLVSVRNRRRICSVADDDSFSSCTVFTQIAALSSKTDRRQAMLALVKLVRVAQSGELLQIHYDEKQCHELFRFTYKGKERTVWRVRNGNIRIAFYYADGKILFLPGVVVKRRDKLKKHEQATLAREVERFVDAEDSHSLIVQQLPNQEGIEIT